jgi:hypothetical protein
VEEKNCEGLSPDPEIPNTNIEILSRNIKKQRAVAQINHLPFDRLRASGDMFKSCDFSAHDEPFFRLRSGHSEKTVHPEPVEGEQRLRTGLSKY